MELLKNLEGLSADEQMTAVVELQKAAMKHLEEQKQASIGKSAELVIQGLKKIKSDFEAKFDSLNYDIQTKVASLKDGEQGLQGPKGDQGERGLDGSNGRDGRDGKDGKDGVDGVDGVGVRDAKIDFDGSLVISLTDGREINCGEVVSVDVAKQIQKVTHNIQTGAGGDSQTVLDAIAAIQATIATYGTMATQNKTSVDIEGGTIDNTTIGATTPSTGVFTTLTATDETNLGGVAGNASLRVFSPSSTGTFIGVTGGSTQAEFRVSGSQNNNSLFLISRGSGVIGFSTGNSITNQQLRVSPTSSAVNYVQVTGAATGGSPAITAQGSDTNVGITVQGKGTGSAILQANSTGNALLATDGGLTAVRAIPRGSSGDTWLDVQRTSGLVALSAASGVTNGAFLVQSKGTGAIDLAAGSSGVNISNGGTVTALTLTTRGSNYTSPSVTISAPTTAGGVQATATATWGVTAANLTIAGGGSGYVVNDVLSLVGGTYTVQATVTVSSVSGGVITGFTVSQSGNYTVPPTNPVSVTGGTGSGATFTLAGLGLLTIAVNNAGSGYVEQPTVTFSGGGGSGAAAFARVGGAVTLTSLGPTLNLNTEAGTGFRVLTAGTTATDMWQAISNGTTAILRSSNATSNAQVQTSGTGGIQLGTSNGVTQCLVSHTASAVNYVQVTGAATGGVPTISAQGSDSNVSLFLNAKGTGNVFLQVGGANVFQAAGSSTSVNRVLTQASNTGVAPIVQAVGSDTNIPLVLQPKGTGALQAQQTDSTATGGNARGANAVDWQTSRSAASQVASATATVIGGGIGNTASGFNASVVGGASNVASNNYAFVGGGLSNSAGLGMSGIVAGYSNQSLGYLNLIAGGYANSGTSGSAVTTQSATMNGTTAVTLSGSNANIKVGQLIIGTSINSFPYTYVAAISGTSLTLSQAASGSSTSTLSFYTPHGVVVGGGNNASSGGHSFVGGGGWAGGSSGGSQTNRATGNWSAVVGGSGGLASGDNSFIGGGGYLIGNGNTASGQSSSVVGGYNNTASGFSATVIGGNSNTTTGNYGVVGGANNTNNGANAVITGGQYGNARSTTGYHVFAASAAPIAGVSGVSQGALVVLGRQTTDATPTILASDNTAVGTSNQVILPNNSAYYFKGTVIANVTGGGNTKGWTIEGAIKRGANAASTALVGTPTVTSSYADAGASTWAITATADTTNGGLAITFTGQAGTTIRVVAKLETTEVTF